MQHRRPPDRAGARAADHLIERHRVGIHAEFVARFGKGVVQHVGLHRQLLLERADDLIHTLVAFVVRVKDAGGVGMRGEARLRQLLTPNGRKLASLATTSALEDVS